MADTRNCSNEWQMMFEILEHNKSDCIRLLNMIICEIPFIKSFSDDCLLERLLNLISIITNAFDYPNKESFDCNAVDSEEERVLSIRDWLCRHYKAKHSIDELDFDDSEDRTRVTVLIINILFKLRHSLKDVEQYLKDCDSFVQFDQQLNDITRFDKLLEIVENDSNKWKSKARYYKVKVDEMEKQINKYRQNEIFNYNCNPRNQNLYKSRISLDKPSKESPLLTTSDDKSTLIGANLIIECHESSGPVLGSQDNADKEFDIGFESEGSDISVNNEDIQYMCAQCDKKYLTNFELNLHYLKDHSERPEHKDIDISDIIKNSKLLQTFNNHNNNKLITKKLRIQKKRTFKCNYRKCNKAFHKTLDLRNHFDRHEPKVDKLYRKVYTDYTNSVLNQLRTPVPKPRRVSNSCNNTNRKKKLSFNIKNDISFNEKDINCKDLREFSVDSHLNYSNCINTINMNAISDTNPLSVRPVPLVLNNNCVKRNSIDSSDYFNESTDEELNSNTTEPELKEIFGLQCNQSSKTNGSTH